jgi:hypothetical protein
MQKPNRIEIARNMLVLAALVGLVLFSWLLGHILRYSIPALWHPPVQERDPQIKYGLEFDFEGIRRFVVLPELAAGSMPAQVQLSEIWAALPAQCLGSTYYTSLPAKCRTVDGRLVQVRSTVSRILLIPPRK